jgi:hypothetical protein
MERVKENFKKIVYVEQSVFSNLTAYAGPVSVWNIYQINSSRMLVADYPDAVMSATMTGLREGAQISFSGSRNG